jgi:hypothetical protein
MLPNSNIRNFPPQVSDFRLLCALCFGACDSWVGFLILACDNSKRGVM